MVRALRQMMKSCMLCRRAEEEDQTRGGLGATNDGSGQVSKACSALLSLADCRIRLTHCLRLPPSNYSEKSCSP